MDISQDDPRFNEIQNIKRKFYALRNGIVADTLRKAGDPHQIIFGLTLPQIKEVADSVGVDIALAEVLWKNKTTRESRLLAPMLYGHDAVSPEQARVMFEDVMCVEEADILCHRLLRHLPFAMGLVADYIASEISLERYTALRLLFNFVGVYPDRAKRLAGKEIERNDKLTHRVAAILYDEACYVLDERLF